MATSMGLNTYSLYANIYGPQQYDLLNRGGSNGKGTGQNSKGSNASKPDVYVDLSSSARFSYKNAIEFPAVHDDGTATSATTASATTTPVTSTQATATSAGNASATTTSAGNASATDTHATAASSGGNAYSPFNALYDGLSKSFSIPQNSVYKAYGAFSFGSAFNTVDILA